MQLIEFMLLYPLNCFYALEWIFEKKIHDNISRFLRLSVLKVLAYWINGLLGAMLRM